MAKLLVPKGLRQEEPVHIARLRDLAKWRLPPEGSQEWIDFRLRMAAAGGDPRYRKSLRDSGRISAHTCFAVVHNGAGLPADSGVREFVAEYNRRTGNYGLHYLPASFNIFEAFTTYVPKYSTFLPLPERDHICSLCGFLESQAEADARTRWTDNPIPEDQIFNYSFVEQPGEWELEDQGGAFVMCSVSLVRHGNEVTALCLGGVERDLAAETKAIEERADVVEPDPDKPLLEADQSLKQEAVALDQKGRFQRAYFGLRFDLTRQKAQARYVFFDDGRSWSIKTDDLVTFDNAQHIKQSELESWIERVEKHSGIFEFIVRLFGLPAYLLANDPKVSTDKAVTSLAEANTKTKLRKKFDRALGPQVIYERQVRSLLPTGSEPSAIYLPPLELEVEVDGYWERLPFGTYGTNASGERVLGRTWVRKTTSRRKASMLPSPIVGHHVKNSVLLENDEGFIYVLRNAAHQLDIFKIGLTRRSVTTRAAELSRGTGIPDAFLTVQAWWVPDVVFAEKRIHQLLAEHRLKDSREFFRADYSVIRSTVDLVVNELAGKSIPA